MRIFFDTRSDEPIVSVSRPTEPKWEPTVGPSVASRNELAKAMFESFPREGRRTGVGARVAVAVDIDGMSGVATGIKATAVDLDWGNASGRLEVLYAAAAEEGAKAATFVILPEHRGQPWRGCLLVNYKIKRDD